MKRYYLVYYTGKLEQVTYETWLEHKPGYDAGFGPVQYMVEEADDFSLEEIEYEQH